MTTLLLLAAVLISGVPDTLVDADATAVAAPIRYNVFAISDYHPTYYMIEHDGQRYHYGDLDDGNRTSHVTLEAKVDGSTQPAYFTYTLLGADGRCVYKWDVRNTAASRELSWRKTVLEFVLWGPTGELYTMEVSSPGYTPTSVSFFCDGSCGHDLGTLYLTKAPQEQP